MRDLAGKTAFVTGGASGIGLAMGYAFAEAGMQVMLADIEVKPLEQGILRHGTRQQKHAHHGENRGTDRDDGCQNNENPDLKGLKSNLRAFRGRARGRGSWQAGR